MNPLSANKFKNETGPKVPPLPSIIPSSGIRNCWFNGLRVILLRYYSPRLLLLSQVFGPAGYITQVLQPGVILLRY